MNVLVNKVILSPVLRSVLPCRHVLGRVLVVEAPHVPRHSYSTSSGAGAGQGGEGGGVADTLSMMRHLTESVRRQNVSNMTQEAAAVSLCRQYSDLGPEEKGSFLKQLSLTTATRDTSSSTDTIVARLGQGSLDQAARTKLHRELVTSLAPPYTQSFTRIGQIQGGVKFLVDMRRDLLDLIKQTDAKSPEFAALRDMNGNLKSLLSNWFSVGFLTLEQVTWHSPCSLVEKICDYEAVHPIVSWTDIKTRVGEHRRCFVYTHPSMPGEPVVILHVALTPGHVADNVDTLVRHREQRRPEVKEECRAAIFYSVTSTQAGLQGIELGTHLIKQAVTRLQAEFPAMTTFSTLSPIPGFRSWLIMELTAAARGEASPLTEAELATLRPLLGEGEDTVEALLTALRTSSWTQQPRLVSALQPVLTRLCARYLYTEKRRNFALNSVANFHLRNGSCLWRINWMADTSRRGLANSCGLMVNYRYYLDRLEANSNTYLTSHTIDADSQVLDLLK